MHTHDHIGDDKPKVAKASPLKMGLRELLGHLGEKALKRRLGEDNAKMFQNGELELDAYISPMQNDAYTFDDLKADDISSFAMVGKR